MERGKFDYPGGSPLRSSKWGTRSIERIPRREPLTSRLRDEPPVTLPIGFCTNVMPREEELE